LCGMIHTGDNHKKWIGIHVLDNRTDVINQSMQKTDAGTMPLSILAI